MLRNSESTYGAITRSLHWTVALLIIGLIALGWYMVGLSYYDKWYNDSLSIHKSLGMLALTLACLKVIWAAVPPHPAFSGTLKPWERSAARATHMVLYAMMVAIPVTGYVISTSAGDSVSFFGWFDIPAALPKSEGLRDVAIELHYYFFLRDGGHRRAACAGGAEASVYRQGRHAAQDDLSRRGGPEWRGASDPRPPNKPDGLLPYTLNEQLQFHGFGIWAPDRSPCRNLSW